MTVSIDPSTSHLTAGELSTDSAKLSLFQEAHTLLGHTPTAAWWVPGRVEVLGKHTDYAGGQVLNCATDVGLIAVARARKDNVIHVKSGDHAVSIPLTPDAQGNSGFSTYVAAVVRRLSRHFPGSQTGCDLAITSNLPAASGMSSSSAFSIAIHHAIVFFNNILEHENYKSGISSHEDLIPYLGGHENGAGFGKFAGDAGVGTSGGSQDHAAIIGSIAGHLNQWSFAPFQRLNAIAWPDSLHLYVAVSGVLAEKSAGARDQFNLVANRARDALAAWNAASGRNDVSLGMAFHHAGCEAVLAKITDPDLRLRAEQTAIETTVIVPGACAALAADDHQAFGALTARSQAMASTHLHNQITETVTLVSLAKDHGAVAASAFGAGFGGSVWAAFPADAQASIAWLNTYQQQFPQHGHMSHVYRIKPGSGVTTLEIP